MNETERINRAKTQLKVISEAIGFNNIDDIRSDFKKIRLCKMVINKFKNNENKLFDKLMNGQKITLNKMVV